MMILLALPLLGTFGKLVVSRYIRDAHRATSNGERCLLLCRTRGHQ